MSQDSIPAVRYATIPRLPGYEFGDDGSVWSYWKRKGSNQSHISATKRRLKPFNAGSGRLMLTVYRIRQYVHRLILEAFVGPCPDGDGGVPRSRPES